MKITNKTPFNTPVRWNPTMKPTAAPDYVGRLVSVKGKVAWVVWDTPNGDSVQAIFRGALIPA